MFREMLYTFHGPGWTLNFNRNISLGTYEALSVRLRVIMHVEEVHVRSLVQTNLWDVLRNK